MTRSTPASTVRPPARAVTPRSSMRPPPAGAGAVPWRTAGSSRTSSTRVAAARECTSRVIAVTATAIPLASSTYWLAAMSSPGLMRPRASSAPATARTAISSSATSTTSCTVSRICARHIATPWRCSSGTRSQHALRLALGGAGGGDRPRAGDRVDEAAGDRALHGEVVPDDQRRVARERPQHEQEDRHPDEEGRAQPGIDQRECDDAADRRDHARDAADDVGRDACRVGGVADEPGGDLARRKVGQRARADREHVREQPVAQVRRRARDRSAGGEVVERVGGDEHGDQQRRRPAPIRRRLAGRGSRRRRRR